MAAVESPQYGQSGVPGFLERVRTRYERRPHVYHEIATLFFKLGQHQVCPDEVIQSASDMLADDPELMRRFTECFADYVPEVPGQQAASQSASGLTADFEDAKEYIYRVKRTFVHRPHVYESFVVTLFAYHSDHIDVGQVNQRIGRLFKNHPALLESFRQFLPRQVTSMTS